MVEPVLALARLAAVHRLEAVAVRVAHEGAVVGRRVLRPRPWRAVVRMPCGGHRRPPRVHLLAGLRDEREVQVPGHRPVVKRPDREVLPFEEVRPAVRLAVAELGEGELVAAARGLEVGHAQPDVIEDVQHGKIVSVILENGVVRTMEPSLPLARSLAIAGELDRRRRLRARDRAARAGARRPRRPLRRARVHRLARALPDLGDGAARGAARGHALRRRGGRARPRRARPAGRPGSAAAAGAAATGRRRSSRQGTTSTRSRPTGRWR